MRATGRRRRPGITLAQYNRVHTGTTLAQVERILGNGVLLDKATLSAAAIYGWDGDEPGHCAMVGFENGRVVGKSQAGLR